MAGVFEGIGEDGEDDAAVGAADEIETAFLLHELELAGHASAIRSCIGSIHGIGNEIKEKLERGDRKFDLYQIGTEPAK